MSDRSNKARPWSSSTSETVPEDTALPVLVENLLRRTANPEHEDRDFLIRTMILREVLTPHDRARFTDNRRTESLAQDRDSFLGQPRIVVERRRIFLFPAHIRPQSLRQAVGFSLGMRNAAYTVQQMVPHRV